MRILLWHVHGSWTNAFVQGDHDYLLPVLPDRGPDGRGRARTWDWPASAIEVAPAQLRDTEIDVVLLQRPHELELSAAWTGRRPGIDVPAVYVEHNCPQGPINEMRHPVADQPSMRLVHVTHFNDLFWDAGATPTTVIEHGIVDPGPHYTGELERAGVVINEPARRARVTGTDLLARLGEVVPFDLFGMDVDRVALPEGSAAYVDLPQATMHQELARRRVYVHPLRWTSLGLSLLEAMHLAMPVVALATTEAVEAVPPEAGVITTDARRLVAAARELVDDAEEARRRGKAARAAALARYGLPRFLTDWDRLLLEVTT